MSKSKWWHLFYICLVALNTRISLTSCLFSEHPDLICHVAESKGNFDSDVINKMESKLDHLKSNFDQVMEVCQVL